MATATTHTAASKAPSKTGGASTRNQRTAIGKLVSRKPATALGPARDGERRGSAEPWSGSALGPTAIGADTRSDNRYFLSGLTTARGAPAWPGTPIIGARGYGGAPAPGLVPRRSLFGPRPSTFCRGGRSLATAGDPRTKLRRPPAGSTSGRCRRRYRPPTAPPARGRTAGPPGRAPVRHFHPGSGR